MKVAIIETVHFQYGLTQSEIFSDSEKLFFVTQKIKEQMMEYNPELCQGTFIIIKSIEDDAENITKKCNDEHIDLFLLNPVFGSFKAVLRIANNIKAQKAITIHNLNTWLNSKFWSYNSLMERITKKKIVNKFDYIIVEDFIYNYVTRINPSLNRRYTFLYIPYTIFQAGRQPLFKKKDDRLKIVLPGTIHRDRRRYEDVISIILRLANEKKPIVFSFAGRPIEEYGINVTRQLDKANSIMPGIASYFPAEGEVSPTRFIEEMQTSDLVLSTSTKEFKTLGTTEYIGKTKPTAAIHDMITFQLPGFLPGHLMIPENLTGSVFNYKDENDLYKMIVDLLDHPEKLEKWKEKAKENSMKFTAEKIRKNLPFFDEKNATV